MIMYILWDNDDETPVGGGEQKPIEQIEHSSRWFRTKLARESSDWIAEH